MTHSQDTLHRMFRPRSIALVGATERSIWSVAAHDNLVRFGFAGRIIPVNPKGGVIHGLPAATSIQAAGEPIDVALLMVPEASLRDTIGDLKAAGVAGAVVLSAGFAETGAEGARRQDVLVEAARQAGIRLLGPNCLGFANFVDAAPVWTNPLRRPMPNPTMALISQSGSVAIQLEQFAYQQRIAPTHMISTGNEADINTADAIEYIAAHSDARAIALFIETVRQPARFAAAVTAAGRAGKAVVVLKVGASEASAKAAQAHTGSLVGNDRVFSALCERLGMIRVFSIEEAIITADLIGRIGRVERPGVALLAMSGGMCEIATDQAEKEAIDLPALTEETLLSLRSVLPDYATPANPLDLTGGAMLRPELIAQSIETISKDPGIGVIGYVFDVPGKADARGVAARFMKEIGLGVAASAIPVVLLSNAFAPVNGFSRSLAEDNGIAYSGGGLRHVLTALGHLVRWSGAVAGRTEPGSVAHVDVRPVREREVLDYLAQYGVPVVPGPVVTSAEAAAQAARDIGGPVVLKIASPDIQHKTEIGGVALGLSGDAAVAAAYEAMLGHVAAARPDAKIDGVIVSPMRGQGTELFVGTMRDPHWGPAIAVGLGGVFVEVLKDTSLRLLPVTEEDALQMLDQLRGRALLDGFRGAPAVDRLAAARAIVAIGNAALALGPDLISLEVNPLLATEGRIEALDGLTVWESDRAHA